MSNGMGAFGFVRALATVALAAGCGPPSAIAPVSGTITLDGEPLDNARVSFIPKAGGEDDLAGTIAFGNTDAEGRYRLRTPDGDVGGTIGENTVTVGTGQILEGIDGESEVVAEEQVPLRYRGITSELRFTAPEGGSDEADFALQSR